MQVDVHGVDAEFARSDLANQCVEVCAVAVKVRSYRVRSIGQGANVRFEYPAGVGIGQHDRRDVGAERSFQTCRVHAPIRVFLDLLHFVTAEGGCGRICAVRGVRDQ